MRQLRVLFDTFRRFYDFSGRSSRREYWLFWLFCLQGDIALAMARRFAERTPDLLPFIAVAGTAFATVVFVPGLAVAVRRLHDTNRTGWWLVLPYAVLLAACSLFLTLQGQVYVFHFDTVHGLPGQGLMARLAYGLQLFGPMLVVIVLPTWLASLVTFRFHIQRGTLGLNRFGPSPLPATPVEDTPDAIMPEATPALVLSPAPAPGKRRTSIYVPPGRPAPPPFETARPAFGKRL